MGKQSIGLSMIVKNEESVLERCLNSVQGYVDEIVIVDTGSTDQTKAIAKSLGAKVFDYHWADDFSAARNYGLAHGATDWILQLDADEELAQNQADLAELVNDPDPLAFFIQFRVAKTLESLSESVASFEVLRLFRRTPLVKYIMPIHERINVDDMNFIKRSKVIINHFGPTLTKKPPSSDRNIPMLLKAVKRYPRDGLLWEQLGTEYFIKQDWRAAYEAYSQSARVSSATMNYIPRLLRDSAMCLFRQGMRTEALQSLQSLQKKLPDFTDLFFLEAELRTEQGEIESADTLYRQCLEKGESPARYGSWAGSGSWRATLGLEHLKDK